MTNRFMTQFLINKIKQMFLTKRSKISQNNCVYTFNPSLCSNCLQNFVKSSTWLILYRAQVWWPCAALEALPRPPKCLLFSPRRTSFHDSLWLHSFYPSVLWLPTHVPTCRRIWRDKWPSGWFLTLDRALPVWECPSKATWAFLRQLQ